MKGARNRTSNEMPNSKLVEDFYDWFECVDQVVWLRYSEAPLLWPRIASESDLP